MTTGNRAAQYSRMSHRLEKDVRTPDASSIGLGAGSTWIAGGAMWLAAGLLHADGGWRFYTAAGFWITADVLLLLGLTGLFRTRPHVDSSLGHAALGVALAARVLFVGGEVVSILQGTDENALIPIGAILTAVSMTTYGIVIARRARSMGNGASALLAMGLYPMVVMFPLVAVTGEPSTVLIAGWGIPAALVGWAIRRGRL